MLAISGSIPIKIYPLFLIVAFMIGWLNTMTAAGTLVWAGVIFISVLVHEYGHALTAKFFGQSASIELAAMGGLTQREGPKLKWWKEFLIVLNGPCAGFLLCAVVYFIRSRIGDSNSLLAYALSVAVYVNLFWTIVNLLPIQPLDGGHLFAIILEGLFGFTGLKVSLFLSIVLATVLSLFFFVFQLFIAGALFLMLAFESFRSWKSSLSITEQDRNVDFQNLLKQADQYIGNGQNTEALHLLQLIRQTTRQGLIYQKAAEMSALILAGKGNSQEAFDLLMSLKNKLSPDALNLAHQLACKLGNWQKTIDLGNRLYQLIPNYEIAIRNAIAYAALNQVQPALGWLQRAQRDGVPNLHAVVKRPEFDTLRFNPSFQDWINRLM